MVDKKGIEIVYCPIVQVSGETGGVG
ncbi:hypothetical protein [Algoriphagus resistens]